MTDILKLARRNIRGLEPYGCAQTEYKRGESHAIFLDANENPFENGCNRYPDPEQGRLRGAIGKIKNISPDNILLGNGSDEIIDLLIRSFCEPREDNIIVFSPGYSMYEISAHINAVNVHKINMNHDLLPDRGKIDKVWSRKTKLIFLCTPSNPAGNTIPLEDIGGMCGKYDSLVVVDEAYIDFAETPSAIRLINEYPNLVVMQTMSKSWGAAGLRIGMCFADRQVTDILSKVKMPYNISSLTQDRALELLSETDSFQTKIETIKKERARIYASLKELGLFRKVYPSEANFILVISDEVKPLYDFLLGYGIVTRIRDIPPLIRGGLRISVGTRTENDKLLEVLSMWKSINTKR